jgi:hypothetical protein
LSSAATPKRVGEGIWTAGDVLFEETRACRLCLREGMIVSRDIELFKDGIKITCGEYTSNACSEFAAMASGLDGVKRLNAAIRFAKNKIPIQLKRSRLNEPELETLDEVIRLKRGWCLERAMLTTILLNLDEKGGFETNFEVAFGILERGSAINAYKHAWGMGQVGGVDCVIDPSCQNGASVPIKVSENHFKVVRLPSEIEIVKIPSVDDYYYDESVVLVPIQRK